MKIKALWEKYRALAAVGSMIPLILLLGRYFDWPRSIGIALVVVLGFIFASMALWHYANRRADGSEWWQDESASGWRGY